MVSFALEHYDRMQEMLFKGLSDTFFERGNVFKWKLVNQRNNLNEY